MTWVVKGQRQGLEDVHRRAAANAAEKRDTSAAAVNQSRGTLAAINHPQQDFFLAQIFDAPLKNDQATMEHPMISLSKTPNLKIRVYEHNGNTNTNTITPSAAGLATIWDKDILLFTISCLVEAQNHGLPIDRSVRLRARDLLVYCNRGTSGAEYDALVKAFERLAGTRMILTSSRPNPSDRRSRPTSRSA